ncbi:3'-exoribonuclease [Candidatus Magnetomoraceae bacterium gMMP-15]
MKISNRNLEKYWRKISKEEINEFPLRRYSGPIYVIKTEGQLKSALKRIKSESVLGFDTETKPSFKKGRYYLPSLVQLACHDSVFLFQLNHLSFHKGLKEILSESSIIKSGVAVKDDVKDLKRLSHFKEGGIIDLGEISRRLGLKTNGLRNMAVNFLGYRISKNEQRSNWAKHNLSPKQITYAATDAWVSREIHIRLRKIGLI